MQRCCGQLAAGSYLQQHIAMTVSSVRAAACSATCLQSTQWLEVSAVVLAAAAASSLLRLLSLLTAIRIPQVISRCISQQVDLLEVLGQLAFSLPEPDDAAYEAKAAAAVEALLKDMEVAQVRCDVGDSSCAECLLACSCKQQQSGSAQEMHSARGVLAAGPRHLQAACCSSWRSVSHTLHQQL
jgi:hypothetical protein